MMNRTTAVLLAALVLPGCFMTKYRQKGVEIARRETTAIRTDVTDAAEAVAEIAQEIEAASIEERQPEISAQVTAAAKALESAHDHTELAGRVLSVMQKDIGRTEEPAPETKVEIIAWCAQYGIAVAAMRTALSVVGSRIPLLKPKPRLPVKGWSPTSIAGLITAALAAAGAAGEGARRGVKRVRRKRADHDAELAEALDALDEVKTKHPKAVKSACAPDRRPHLRAAFVRRPPGGGEL